MTPVPGISGDRPPKAAARIIVLVAGLFATALSWAAFAHVEEVTRGSGKVIPSSRTQVVQTSEPGVVQGIQVRQGEQVRRGQLLIRIDATPSAAKAGESEAQMRALLVQIARLQLETNDVVNEFACPPEVQARAPAVCQNEQRLFEARKANLASKLEGLRQRPTQREREIGENKAQIVRISESLRLAEKELDILGPLARRKLVSQVELVRAQRQVAESKGQLAVVMETVGRLQAAFEEANAAIEESKAQFRREALNELTIKRAELSVLQETLKGAEDRVRRTEVRSPVDGVINVLAVTTIGAYVSPGDRLMDIVPTEDRILIETRVRPADIAFIAPGQRARVKVSAYDFYQYGGIEGAVDQVSPDSVIDPQSKEAFFIVMVSSAKREIMVHAKAYPILPGMQADIDIITGDKTILTYLLKPIRRGLHESLTER